MEMWRIIFAGIEIPEKSFEEKIMLLLCFMTNKEKKTQQKYYFRDTVH